MLFACFLGRIRKQGYSLSLQLAMLLSFAVPVAGRAFAQSIPDNAAAKSIFISSLDAMCPASVQSSLHDIVAVGRVSEDQANPTATSVAVRAMRPGRLRIDTKGPGGSMSYVQREHNRYLKKQTGAIGHSMQPYDQPEHDDIFPLLSMLDTAADANSSFIQYPDAVVSGRPAHVISVSGRYKPQRGDPSPAKRETLYYIDTATAQLMKISYKEAAERNTGSLVKTSYYLSYQDVASCVLPREIDTYINDHLTFSIVLTSIELNKGLTDADFPTITGVAQ